MQNTSSKDEWDDEIDFLSISVPVLTSLATGFSGGSDYDLRPQRREFPVPDKPPYKARIGNLPWEVTEAEVRAWVEEGVGADSFLDFYAPQEDGRLRGFAFVTFHTRELLVAALDMNALELNGRRVYVSVAAPQGDREGRPPREDFDWGARRGPLAPREDEFQARGPRPERQDPNLDWGARRGPLEPRERKPRREEPDLDWSARRGPPEVSRERRAARPPKEEPEFDWNARRGPLATQPKEQKEWPKRDTPEFDWSTRRGPLTAKTESRAPKQDFDWSARRGPVTKSEVAKPAAKTEVKQQDKGLIKKSMYDVLGDEEA